jgi:transcription initiation factor TFIIB
MSTTSELIKKEIAAGKDPMGLSCSKTILYLSCLTNGESTTQKDIAQVARVTEVTVRNRLSDLKNRLNLN